MTIARGISSKVKIRNQISVRNGASFHFLIPGFYPVNKMSRLLPHPHRTSNAAAHSTRHTLQNCILLTPAQ